MAKSKDKNGLTQYRIDKVEEQVSALHARFDAQEEKSDRQFAEMKKWNGKLNTNLATLTNELQWVKKVAVGAGAVSGFIGGIVGVFTGLKPPL